MKNHYKFIAVLALASSSLFAQQTIPCATDEAMYQLFAKDPAAKARYEKSQQVNKNERGIQNTVSTIFPVDTVPIVFHILHINGAENISDAIVYQCLKEVNLVNSKMTPDTFQIVPYFKPKAAANNYVFKLATKDPLGSCTNGIEHVYDVNTDWNQGNFSNYTHTWDPTKYLNIYIVRQIIGGGGPGTIVGYTYLPGTFSPGDAADAIIYNNQFMTGINARSLAHEIGHWMGLSHTFGSTNSPGVCMSGGLSDDFLSNGAAGVGVTDDTPKTPGAFSTCPPSTPNSCDVSNYQNVQNIMDYSSCPINFTNGQAQRMHNTMALSTAGRNNISSVANKIATGVRYPQICIPIANFKSSARVVCPNSIIIFSDSSANARPTAWKWNFTGGTLQSGSTVNDSMPKVSYAAAGTYAVSYTATSSAGSNSITKSTIFVNSNVATYSTTFTEGFETATLPNTDWSIYSNTSFNWAATANAAATGVKSAWIDNFSNTPGNNSVLQSTSFDISGFITPTFTFKLAYQQQLSTNADKVQIFSSTDCGNTWVSRWSRQGAMLANVTPPSTAVFTPVSSQFNTYTVNINGVSGSPNVRFKFEFFADPNGQGNNLYLDDINLFDATPNNVSQYSNLNAQIFIYPNPASGKMSIDFNLSENHNIAVTVTDVIGRAVETIAAKQYAAGETKITIAEKASYQAGVYFVNINVDGKIISKKIVVQ